MIPIRDTRVRKPIDQVDWLRAEAVDRKAVLSAGIQDIINALVDKFNLNDVLRIILETMYRGLGCQRVLVCLRDKKRNVLQARLGFGNDIDLLIRQFAVPLGKSADVFQVTLDRHADVLLSDINADNIRERIPEWYRTQISAQTFILLPLIVERNVLGLFYADCQLAGELTMQPQELNLLKTLRNQAVLAIRQKQLG